MDRWRAKMPLSPSEATWITGAKDGVAGRQNTFVETLAVVPG